MYSIVIIFVVLFVSTAVAFAPNGRVISRQSMKMMFGGAKKSVASKVITVTADGKPYECGEAPFNLRKELIAKKVDVYPLKAKLTGNCGGAGICGTCAVRVLEGGANLNPPSKNEQNTLNGKPADFRLSCCARVNGNISIKTKP